MLTAEEVQNYIMKCLGSSIHPILEIREIRSGSGCDVFDCQIQAVDIIDRCILKVYRQDFDDYSRIGIVETARKVLFASSELGKYSIKIPKVLGSYLSGEVACIVTEKLSQTEWETETRAAAAKTLVRLHDVPLQALSHDLQELVVNSRPNRDRVRLGVVEHCGLLDENHPRWRTQYRELSQSAVRIIEDTEPLSSMTTLVHGDYFSKNLIPTEDNIYVIDWDLLALGDPMWDLGFLLGAETSVNKNEAGDVISVYQRTRPIDLDVLSWHIECWSTFRELGKIIREYSENPR